MKKVSVIVPAYEVELYIDQCLASICKQTFQNIEIIIVYDSSNDQTLKKCRIWEKRDKRIKLLINSERSGLGTARNRGLREASGDYVVYVDSDDWMKENYIEALYYAIEETNANYVSSIGFYKVTEGETELSQSYLSPGEYCDLVGKALILSGEFPAVWKKIYNRKWLLNNELYQPGLFCYEDWGYNMAMVLSTSKIVLIPEIGMFYRISRKNRLSNQISQKTLCENLGKTIEFGLCELSKRGILERFKALILQYCLRELNWKKQMAVLANDKESQSILEHVMQEYLCNRLGYSNSYIYENPIVFGSFTSRWAAQRCLLCKGSLEYYGFSSLISSMCLNKRTKVSHENPFRQLQIEQDISGAFSKKICELSQRSLLLIDFMEERYDVLKSRDGIFLTRSEAYCSAEETELEIDRSIQSDSEEFITYWQASCLTLIELLKKKENILDIVLIRSRLSTEYGNLITRQRYENQAEILRSNARIENLEEFFLLNCEKRQLRVITVELPKHYCMTEENFRYGCKPQYMNEMVYVYLGIEIFKKILERKDKNASRIY